MPVVVGTKLSGIAPSGAIANANTRLAGYDASGPTDLTWTPAQIAAALNTVTTATPGTLRIFISDTGVGFNAASIGHTIDAGGVMSVNPPSMAVYSTDPGIVSVGLFQVGLNANGVGARLVLLCGEAGGKRWDIGSGQFGIGDYTLYNNTDGVAAVTIKPTGIVVLGPGHTVAGLPAGVAGARDYVIDSNLTMAGNFGADITGHGSGANHVPLFYDDVGSVWRIG